MLAVARNTVTIQQSSGTVTLKVIILSARFIRLQEEFTTSVFPYTAIIVRSYCAYTRLFHFIIHQYLIASVSDSELHTRLIWIFAPIDIIYYLKMYVIAIKNLNNLLRFQVLRNRNFLNIKFFHDID